MSDLFNDFNKILKKDLFPVVVKYFKDPKNKITNKFNDFFNDPKILLTDILEKFSKNKNNDNNQINYTEIENLDDADQVIDDEYDNLLKRLILIEENMIKIEKILKDVN
tara:strand:+ start:685 stop:1011 length:327 start_codon:yes stop_codon:yes gene_type:complete